MKRIAKRLVSDLSELLRKKGRAILVIDGDCAAGKTTLAAQIAAQIDCNVFHMDDFFLPSALRTEARLAEIGGNIDYERFLAQVLKPMQANKPFTYGAYSCKDGTTHYCAVQDKPVAVIEGSYALHPNFLATYQAMGALKVFLRIDAEEQLKRIQTRNGDTMLRRFREEWIPMEKRYQQAYRSAWGNVTFIDG
ncbi:MAG TPA: uridine kinase [Candidatus Limiplasma sp.]|nr:uridine kinase [Candidatus Limiplasma sp.]